MTIQRSEIGFSDDLDISRIIGLMYLAIYSEEAKRRQLGTRFDSAVLERKFRVDVHSVRLERYLADWIKESGS